MSERTVLSAFYTDEEAKQALAKIKELGIQTTQIDELHAYGGMTPHQHAAPISGDIPSLASLTLDTSVSSRDIGILLAADPAASGMSGGEDDVTGRQYLLTTVSPEDLVEDVVRVIKECNGYT